MLAHARDEVVHDLGPRGRGRAGRRAGAARAAAGTRGGDGRGAGRGLRGRRWFGTAVAAARGERQRRNDQQGRQTTSVHRASRGWGP
ncbi:hypothetical protein E1281_34180 [Actinomadura sp. KC345]|nr:hypothetical protein E1281_34180 [Actinomadura sp. KC345]